MFRSISLVLADNAQSEYAFVSTFFGQHSTLHVPEPRTPSLFASSNGSSWTLADRDDSSSRKDNATALRARPSLVPESESGRTSVSGSARPGGVATGEREERARNEAVDTIWKSVMEPAQEYSLVSSQFITRLAS